jgi:hypothetical protein
LETLQKSVGLNSDWKTWHGHSAATLIARALTER